MKRDDIDKAKAYADAHRFELYVFWDTNAPHYRHLGTVRGSADLLKRVFPDADIAHGRIVVRLKRGGAK